MKDVLLAIRLLQTVARELLNFDYHCTWCMKDVLLAIKKIASDRARVATEF